MILYDNIIQRLNVDLEKPFFSSISREGEKIENIMLRLFTFNLFLLLPIQYEFHLQKKLSIPALKALIEGTFPKSFGRLFHVFEILLLKKC